MYSSNGALLLLILTSTHTVVLYCTMFLLFKNETEIYKNLGIFHDKKTFSDILIVLTISLESDAFRTFSNVTLDGIFSIF